MKLKANNVDNHMLSTEKFTTYEQDQLLHKIQVASVQPQSDSSSTELQLLEV